MAIRFYDEALVNKIQKWLPEESNLRILKPEETQRLFKNNADLRNDKPMTLPFFALSRKTRVRITNTNKKPMSFDGMKVFCYDNAGNIVNKDTMVKLNAVPMEIEYQLDVYTKELAEADEYMRNLYFNFINYPNVEITIPYNDCKLKHESTVYISNDVEDTSDIPERLVPGEFTRYTFSLTIDNAYLFSVPIKKNLLISNVSLEIKSNEKDVDETSTIVDSEI